MTKPVKTPNQNRPITPEETRAWRASVLDHLVEIEEATYLLLKHFTAATHFATTITSEPLDDTDLTTCSTPRGGITMPQGTIPPNSRAVVTVVPLSVDNVPTALDGNLQAIFQQPAIYTIDSLDPLNIILKVDPPDDIDAQPQTVCTISDDADSDPTLDITFDWQKAIVIIKAVQFNVNIGSEPL